MALLDPLVNGVARFIEGFNKWQEETGNSFSQILAESFLNALGPLGALRRLLQESKLDDDVEAGINEADRVIDEALGGLFDTVEDDITEELTRPGPLKPANVEDAINAAEGAAVEDALAIVAGQLGIELAGGTQLESHEEVTTRILSFLALEDVLGRRLGMLYEKGVDPALEADIAKKTRSEFVNLQDAVEYALRNKESDTGWLQGGTAPADTVDKIGSNEPVNPNNLVEEWGIRDDQLEILERVGLEAVEIEELVESPVQFGVVPDPETVDEVLQISGLPEATKDLFRRTIEQAPRAADLWEQRTTTGDLVTELDSLVMDGTITPADALDQLPDEAEEARPALQDRWELLADIEAGTPSQTDIEGSLAFGGLSPQAFRDQLDAAEFPVDKFPGVVDATIVGEADGDLRTGVGLGLLSESDYVSLLTDAGLDEGVVDRLLRGEDLDDIASSRLTDETRTEGQTLQTIPQVGPDRAELLRDAGITTVQDVVQADPELIADALVISTGFAERLQTAAEIALNR